MLARWWRIPDADAAKEYRQAIFTALTSQPERAVICADWSRGSLVSPESADVFYGMLTTRNDRIERSAILISGGKKVFDLQVERLVKQAAHPNRRTFRDVDAQLAYLAELLPPADIARARAFLAAP